MNRRAYRDSAGKRVQQTKVDSGRFKIHLLDDRIDWNLDDKLSLEQAGSV